VARRGDEGIRKRCTCGRKRWTTCPHSWHFHFFHGGREHRCSLSVVARARREPEPQSKTEACLWRDRLRAEIISGAFVDHPESPRRSSTPALPTVGEVATLYLRSYLGKSTGEDGRVQWSGRHLRPKTAQQAEYHVKMMRRTAVPDVAGGTVMLDDKALRAVTKADIEGVRETRLPHGTVGTNRLLARVRHFLNWSVAESFLDSSPFKRGGVTVIKLNMRAEHARQRRLSPGEEDALLRHARPHLRAMITAALSTGCRRGELLSLQWSEVRRDENGDARWIVLPAAKTKTNETRVIPVGPRLRAELAMRQHAPDGAEHASSAFVFGNECGEQIESIKMAWNGTCARAGITGLRFHDLRREFACRLLESGAEQHDVRDFLGHANITTTSRYLASTPVRLARALARMESAPIRTKFAQNENEPDEPDSDVAANLLEEDELAGEPGRNRTYNQQIKSLLLCQLSYGPTLRPAGARRN
jgi:integrase